MMSDQRIPNSHDVMEFLNERLAARGLPYRIDQVVVLPYVNPMWMANWEAPELAGLPERDVIDEELREARWRFPQILQEF